MFNTYNYDSNNYDALDSPLGDTDQDEIVFNGYSLQNSSIIITDLIHETTPQRDFITQAVPRNHGETINGDFWRRKRIRARGILKKSTGSLLEAAIDELKKELAVQSGNLDIKVDGTIRRYVATLVNGDSMFDRRGFHITFIPFELEFACLTPFGQSKGYVSTAFVDETDLTFTESFYNGGTTEATPAFIFNFSAANTVTAIKVENTTTGEEITLTTAINAGDYVKFDGETKEVTLNGTVQDYTGFFPSLDTGANSITVTLTATSATYTMTEKHKTPYL